jgi:hypothetical protein
VRVGFGAAGAVGARGVADGADQRTQLWLRQAELLGLRWAALDLAAGRLEVLHSLQRVLHVIGTTVL